MREWFILLEWSSQSHLITISHISTPLIIISVICHLRFSTIACNPTWTARFLFSPTKMKSGDKQPPTEMTESQLPWNCAISLSLMPYLSQCSNFHLHLISTPQAAERGNERSAEWVFLPTEGILSQEISSKPPLKLHWLQFTAREQGKRSSKTDKLPFGRKSAFSY